MKLNNSIRVEQQAEGLLSNTMQQKKGLTNEFRDHSHDARRYGYGWYACIIIDIRRLMTINYPCCPYGTRTITPMTDYNLR